MSNQLTVQVFTHPACAGCPGAVKRAWKLSEAHPEIELKTVSLANKEGLAQARTFKVTTIPTLILSAGSEELKRWAGTPAAGDLEASVSEFA